MGLAPAGLSFSVLRHVAREDYGHPGSGAVQNNLFGQVDVEVFTPKPLPHRQVEERSKLLLLLYRFPDTTLPRENYKLTAGGLSSKRRVLQPLFATSFPTGDQSVVLGVPSLIPRRSFTDGLAN